MTSETIIDLLTIEDKQTRREKFELVLKHAEEHQVLLANAYMQLAEKNQDEDFKKHTRFLKIFPQYFAKNMQSFYEDPEIETIKKLLLDFPNISRIFFICSYFYPFIRAIKLKNMYQKQVHSF